MARIKIDYGIDLGTTNSAICRMENGEPIIKKTDVQKDIMPSCVSVNKKGTLRVGDTALNDLKADKRRSTRTWKLSSSNAYVEFKRTMGTDKLYPCSYLGKEFSSEELSSEVLKALKSFVSDESFNSVVVTVPAKFTVNQKTATLEAAKLAGFQKCELLQEPIAAAMAYGLTSSQDNGIWMVFDFGGGTFDAALIRVEDGIIQVFDTEGDNYLGGKNLDYAIVDEIIIPYLQDNFDIDEILNTPEKKSVLRDAMKTYAEPVKNQLSFKESEDIITDLDELGCDDFGEEIEIDMTISQDEANEVMKPYFQKAVDICKKLLERNNLTGNNLDKIILVGGPTHSPLVRKMLAEQISPKVDTSIDPMTAVAKGAALYASTIDSVIDQASISSDKVRLDLNYESTSVENVEYITVVLNTSNSNSSNLNKVLVELANSTFSSGKVEVDATGNVIEVLLTPQKANQFNVLAYDEYGNRIKCFPDSITIIQGTKVGAAILPYYISIGVYDIKKQEEYCQRIEGLEKNKPIPATGNVYNLKTSAALECGNPADKVVIPVYQSETVGENIQSKYFEHVTDIIISGDEVNTSIPEGSKVNVSVNVDSNEQMEMEVKFHDYDITIRKTFNTTKKQNSNTEDEVENNFAEADKLIEQLKKEGIDTSVVDTKLDEIKTESENNDEGKMVLQHQKEVIREIEQLQSESEFDRVMKKLNSEIKMLEEDQDKYGDEESRKQLDQILALKNETLRKQDVELAKQILELAHSLDFKIARVEYYIAWILNWNKNFDNYSWSDASKARELIDRALEEANNNATADDLRPYIDQLLELVPKSEQSTGAMGRLIQG